MRVRSTAIATGVAIPTTHDDSSTNREVNRSVMDDLCLAASAEKTNKQTNNQRKKTRNSNHCVLYQN